MQSHPAEAEFNKKELRNRSLPCCSGSGAAGTPGQTQSSSFIHKNKYKYQPHNEDLPGSVFFHPAQALICLAHGDEVSNSCRGENNEGIGGILSLARSLGAR